MAGMTPMRRRMIEDMSMRNLSPVTQRCYLHAVTGFSRHFNWIESPSIAAGCDPVHVRGVSTQPGLFFLGLRWLHTRRSASYPVHASPLLQSAAATSTPMDWCSANWRICRR